MNQSTGPRCECGADATPDTPAEDEHFVWALRPNGTRSNLGYCPVVRPVEEAIRKAHEVLGGHALYHNRIYPNRLITG